MFIVGALVAFGAGIFWIGGREFAFNSTYKLNAEFPNVAGLGDGATVRVGGIHEGTVHRILLPAKPDQKVRVEMNMRESTRNVLKKDSVAAIRTAGLVGDQYVEISFGSVDAPRVNNGDMIPAEPPLQISDMVKKTNAILDSAQGAVRNIGETAGNLQVMTSKLNAGKGTAGAFVNDRSLYEHVNRAAANLQDDTEALKHNFFLRGFFKNRGYEDTTDLKRNAISELPSGVHENHLSYRSAKLFDKRIAPKSRMASCWTRPDVTWSRHLTALPSSPATRTRKGIPPSSWSSLRHAPPSSATTWRSISSWMMRVSRRLVEGNRPTPQTVERYGSWSILEEPIQAEERTTNRPTPGRSEREASKSRIGTHGLRLARGV
jgi:phospholipid/cholesterol/gamma-HCH transport system substrate-binding protein